MTPKIALCVPSTGICRTAFAMCVTGLVAYFPQERLSPECEEQYLRQFWMESSGIAHNRHQLVKKARAWGATHIFFLDEDMAFPANALHMLFRHRQMWVGANYAMRSGPPYEFTALNLGQKGRVITHRDSTGLEECAYTGFGCTLLDVTLFDKVGEPPWFLMDWLGGPEDQYSTEDAYFSAKVRKAGIPIFVDHDLSKMVQHVGLRNYTWQDVAGQLAAEAARTSAEVVPLAKRA